MQRHLLWVVYGLVMAGGLCTALLAIGLFEYRMRTLSVQEAAQRYWYLGALVVGIGLLLGVLVEMLMLQ